MKRLFSRLFLSSRRPHLAAGHSLQLALFVALTWLLPSAAHAQATVGDVMCNVWVNLQPFAELINAICWTIGGILIGIGLIHLRDHSDSPANKPLYQAILQIGGGAALMTLPFFVSFICRTIFVQQGPAGGDVCVAGAIVGAPLPDLVTMLENFIGNVGVPLLYLIGITSFVMGTFFIAMGIIKASKYGTDPRGSSIPTILVYFFIGGCLMCSGDSLGSMIATLFGGGTLVSMDYVTNANEVLGWAAVQDLGGTPGFAMAISVGLTFIQLIGALAVVRGLYIVKNAVEGSGQATMAQGLTHLVGGTLAVNIFQFLEYVDATFGTGLL